MARVGKYKVIADLGRGGMADVFLATADASAVAGFQKLVVVKKLRANLADDPEFVGMFIDEARISSRLNHPNVVQTLEVGKTENDFFIVMEYLDGQPFHRLLHRARSAPEAFPSELRYLVVCDALVGLHYAHELLDYDRTPLSIVHRDMTPHNVFVTYDGQVKVVDFGIAKASRRFAETREGVMKGKVRYMPPEQAMGGAIDRRADIFSVGMMLWEIATGSRVWKSKEDLQILTALVTKEPIPPPISVNKDVPAAVSRICERALAYEKEGRFSTAEEMRLELEQHLLDSGSLLEARRRLGPAVAERFADNRRELRNVIEQQLAALRQHSASTSEFSVISISEAPRSLSNLGVPDSAPSDSKSLSSVHVDAKTDSQQSSLVEMQSRKTRRPPAQERRTRAILVSMAVATVLFMSLAILTLVRPRNQAVPRAGSGSGDQADPSAVKGQKKDDPSSPAGSDDMVTLTLAASPRSARITVDGRLIPDNPYHSSVPRDDQEHVVRITAPHYTPLEKRVRYSADIDLDIALDPATALNTRGGRIPPAPPPPNRVAPPPTVAPAPSPTSAPPPPEPEKPIPSSTRPPRGDTRPAREIDPSNPFGGGSGSK